MKKETWCETSSNASKTHALTVGLLALVLVVCCVVVSLYANLFGFCVIYCTKEMDERTKR